MSRQKPIIQIDAKKQRELAGALSDFRSVRPSVYQHAKSMEKRLKEKDSLHNGNNWHDGNYPFYMERAMECLFRIAEFLRTYGKDSKDYIGIKGANQLKNDEIHWLIKKCIDGSNFLMMLADNLKDELKRREVKEDGN